MNSENRARSARIEAALVGSSGLLVCLLVTRDIAGWESQIEEKREMLARAALDLMALQCEAQEPGAAMEQVL